jgi:hypothetical protein
MYNLRYHIASLMAVFLSLALGLVLGGLAVGGGMIDRQQGALVKGLQSEFSDLRGENRSLANDNKMLKALSSDFVKEWSKNRLSGRTVIVLTQEGHGGEVDSVRDAVEAAGASVAVVTLIEPRFGLGLESGSVAASMVAGAAEPLTGIADALVREWRQAGGVRPMTAALVESGAMRIDNMPAAPGEVCLVSLAGRDGAADLSSTALLRSFGAAGIAVGAETPADHTGAAEAASDAGLAGMDTLGTPVGDYTIVALLSHKTIGYYGSAIGAKDAYPPLTLK